MKIKRSATVGTLNQSKKNISNPMTLAIKKYQKHLQVQENVRYGRKAKHISFVFATKKPKEFAKFMLEVRK
jgi:predicted N-formylglutamate amidohydrolase